MSKYNMRFTILGIQQSKMLEYGLDLTDALLIDTLKGMYASPSFERIIEKDITYMWINQTFLLDYIPIIGSRATLQRRLNKLEELGFINRIVKTERKGKKGKFSYIALLPKIDKLTEYNTINNPKTDEEDKDLLDKSDESSSVDNFITNDTKKVIHKEENLVKPDEIAKKDTMSQNETTPCIKMKQPLYQDETTLVSKRHNKDSLNKDSLFIDTQSINQDGLNDKTKENLEDKNLLSQNSKVGKKGTNSELEILNKLNEKYDIEIVKESILKAKKAKESGTVINNLYAYLDKICQQLVEDHKVLDKVGPVPSNKKTKFHNFEQTSDKDSNKELEDVAKRKREAFMKEIGMR